MARFSGARITRAGIIFIIGIVVLAGLVFGGVMIAKNRGEQVRRDEAIKIAEQTLKDQSEAIATGAVDGKTPETTGSTGTTGTTGSAGSTGSTGSTGSVGTNGVVATTGTATTGTATTQLPATGPTADLGRLASVAILAVSIAVYVASRRTVQRG